MFTQILPSIGCSLEVLDLLCQLVDAALERDDPEFMSSDHLRTLDMLERHLTNLSQIIRLISEGGSIADEWTKTLHARNLAELYRLACMLYLERICRKNAKENEKVQRLISEAMDVMRVVCTCERPWPLFIIAMEARSEEERKLVMDVLGESLKRRPLGNLPLLRRMITAAWVQQDLYEGDEYDPMVIYSSTISGNRVPPSFT